MTASIPRLIVALLFAAQFMLFEWAVLFRGRFASVPGGTPLVALIGAAVYVTAIAFVLGRLPRWRIIGGAAVAAAILVTARFHVPLIVDALRKPAEAPMELVTFLRELSAAQEQYRLTASTYASSVDSLRKWTTPPPGTSVRIERRGDIGWSARVTMGEMTCGLWARDSTTRTEPWHPEGLPVCGKQNPRAEYASRTILVAPAAEVGFRDTDVSGEWLQHRVDERRTGILSSNAGGSRWTASVAGELRASAAVAGNQVFVGAHGNGELVVFSLDSGKLGYRMRVPNWIHHEPVVTPDLFIVGFGNSEARYPRGPLLGSAPSGVAAYDRRTGVERWRRYTTSSVMVSPVIRDSLVAVVTHEGEAIAWRIRDGAVLWRTMLNQRSPMANPLLRDTLMFAGVEFAGLCALDIRTGRTLYCRELAKDGWGSGHSSPTLAGNSVLVSYHTLEKGFWLKALLGIQDATVHGSAMLVSLEAETGNERWRLNLGRGIHDVVGHIAGTPVVIDGVAYVTAPSSGRIVAIHADSGRVLWSADVRPARGSVLVTNGAVLSASAEGEFVVLDAANGSVRCRQKLPGRSDRAAVTLAGHTGILTLRNGLVMTRPIEDWLACEA